MNFNFSENQDSNSHREMDDSTEASGAPAIVVYLVEPFTYGEHWRDCSRLATLGLLRSYNEMHADLPPSLQPQVHLQVRIKNL